MTTADDVATWMLSEMLREEYIEQERMAMDIDQRFGEAFVYTADSGHLAIDKTVLRKFRKLSEESIVWVRSEKAWRKRDPQYDEAGKRQQ